MQEVDYRRNEVKRALDHEASQAIIRLTTELAQSLSTDLLTPKIRPARASGDLVLLGINKMQYVRSRANAGSDLALNPVKTLHFLSYDLRTNFNNPLDLRISSIGVTEEQKPGSGNQAVVVANLSPELKEVVGQEYASRRLQEVSGCTDVRPYPLQIRLLFGSLALLEDGWQRQDVLRETTNALRFIGPLAYGAAKHPNFK